MKIKIANYTFDALAKSVTFTDYTSIRLDSVLIITNVDTNKEIYNFGCSGVGGTVVNNVLTLDFDTTSMSNTDKLQIFYDDPTLTHSTNETQVNVLDELKTKLTQDDYYLVLNTIKDAVSNPLWYNEAINGLTIGGTVAVSSGTINTLSDQTNIGGQPANMMVENTMNQDWALSNRSLYI